MGEFGIVRCRVQKLRAALFSHFLCIFDHQGNLSLAEKKGEKQNSLKQRPITSYFHHN